MGTILLIILILLLIGALPRWPYSTGWGYYPVGGLGLLLIIILILVLLGAFSDTRRQRFGVSPRSHGFRCRRLSLFVGQRNPVAFALRRQTARLTFSRTEPTMPIAVPS